MPTQPVIFSVQSFVATAQELLDIAAQNVYNTYPPYNLDIYNSYTQKTLIPPPPTFVPRPIPQPIRPSRTGLDPLYPVVQNKTEGDMISFGINQCDIFGTDLEYDLDLDNLADSDIVLNQAIQSHITQFDANISGIWRPFFLYIDSQNPSVRNTLVSRSAAAQEDPYEAGLIWENFITINNPVFKNWTLSGGTQFKVDWKIPKDNFLTNQVLGLLFWYRYYDKGREANIRQTFEITPYEESVSNVSLSETSYQNTRYKGQHEDHKYTETSSHVNVQTYGLHSGLSVGDKVVIKENNIEYVYEVTNNDWINLGKKRFIPGLDIYIPDDQFAVYFGTSFDRKEWNERGTKPEEVSVFSYPKTQLITKDIDRYSNILNKLLNFENNIGLQNLFIRSPRTSATGGTSGGDDEGGSLDGGIYMDNQIQNEYIAIKNLARFLATAPVGATEHIRATDIRIDNLNFKNFDNINKIKTDLENIFGHNPTNGGQIAASGNIVLGPQTSVSVMTNVYNANIRSQNNLAYSFQNNLVHTKKDLLIALFKKNKKNRYVEFPKGRKTKLVSKFSVEEPHLRVLLDFQDVKVLGSNQNNMNGLWYKQRINVAGLDLFTRLKFPDASALGPNEREALVLKYIDTQGQDTNKEEVFIAMSMDWADPSDEYYNQVLTSVYEKLGIAKLFQQKYNIENNFLISDNSGDFYDVLFTNQNGDNLKILKNTTYQENQTFDNAVRFFKYSIDEYAEKDDKFNNTINLVEQRFRERSSGAQAGVFPNIKEVYFHRLGGFYLTSSSFFTFGMNKFFYARTAPVGMSSKQYFLPQSIRPDVTLRTEENRKITIEFDCGADTAIELYGVNITRLRDNTLEHAACRPFPNKTPVDGDEVSVYNAIIGYDYNEASHILTTQFVPPIVSYGGHREEDISALGLKILNHPVPIASGDGSYPITQQNVIPLAAKSSFYYNRDQEELNRQANELGVSVIRDKSLVKCFLTPTDFANEITFRKGFFHPNKGWIDYTLLSSDLNNKTAVKSIKDSPCRIYTGTGSLFREIEITKADDAMKAGTKIKTGKDYSILVRDPMETYMDGSRGVAAIPNLLTIEIDPNTQFITHLSVILKNLTHPVPKELKIGLFDALEQRWIAFNYIKAYLERLLAANSDTEDPNYAKKIQAQIAKERNAWLGPWNGRERSLPRNVLFHSSLLNYGSNFNAIFTNFSKKSSKYAFSNDFILPAQSLDYYIGTSGTYSGFWDYDGPIPDSGTPSDWEPGMPLPPQPEFTGDPSTEVGRTWGLQISDMGAQDEGGACFDLQVCTGCPVPGYTQSYIFNRFLYNNSTFNEPYPSGYNFIANFRNKQHLLPPINLDAPYATINPEYPKQDVGIDYPVELGCIPQPDPPRPRETPVPVLLPPPVFLPPFHPSIVGLLTYIAAAETLQAAGYGWDLGFLTGAFFPSPFYFGTTRREKVARYMENKGYLQVEGSTDAAKQLAGFQVRNIGLYDDVPFGQADKIQLEIKHPNGLWYNVEADIFRYSSHSSPVLENTKFNYLKSTKYLNQGESADQLYTKPLSYPAFDMSIDSLITPTKLAVDGVRAYYSFMKGESIELNYALARLLERQVDDGPCVSCREAADQYARKSTVTITNIYIETAQNRLHKPSELQVQDPTTTETSLGPPEILYPEDFTDENPDPESINAARVIIEFTPALTVNNEIFLNGVIHKTQGAPCSSFMLFDPIVTDGKIATSGNVNYKRGQNDQATPQMFPVASGFDFSYANNTDIVNFGKWSNVRDRSLGAFTSSYIYDQLYAEGGLGWGTNLIKPESIPVIGNNERYPTLLDLDYHFSKTNYCGRVKFTKGYNVDNTHIGRVKFNPRLTYPSGDSYGGMPHHPYTSAKEDDFISFTGHPRPLDLIPNRIYAHNVLSISEQNAKILDIDAEEMYQRYRYNPDIMEYYLPFYDLTLGADVLDSQLIDASPVTPTGITAASGFVELENIFNNNRQVIYDNNYYWISIPGNASGVISGSSKIPIAVIQKCFHSKGTFSYCANMCNVEGRGPVWPNMDNVSGSSHESIYKLPSENVPRANGVTYEERQTSQTYYVGCGEIRNDSLVRMDVIQVYEVPEQSRTYVPVSELLNVNDITVRFKYLPRKIPTDFKVTLGNNIVNQSQLYLWECHKTNIHNVYNSSTLTNNPPFYVILNEMIFRAWFGERQKIAISDTYDEKIFITQNHYKWVPYDYDDTSRFNEERNV